MFGRIEGTVTHDGVSVPSTLLKHGKEDLEKSINAETTIEVTAADLHELDVNVEALRVGRMTRVVSKPHKWDKYMLLSKMEINLDDIKSSRITLGATYKSYMQNQIEKERKTSAIVTKNMSNFEEINNDFSKVKKDISTINNIIVDIPSEYVSSETFNNYKQSVISKLSRVCTLKGSVKNYADLCNLQNNHIGDIYNVIDTGANYVYTEDGWDKLSENIDLSKYMTKSDAEKDYVLKNEFEKLIERVAKLEGGNE